MENNEIKEVKMQFELMCKQQVIDKWELPYENILTRLSAAIFYFTPTNDDNLDYIWKELEKYERLTYRKNNEKELSQLEWEVEFNRNIDSK